MTLNKTMIAICMAMGIASFAHAGDAKPTDQGHGRVNFHGSIIDSPCSIDTKSVDQKIELGEISSSALENSGSSTPKPFQIMLKKCSISTMKTVTTTFTGPAGQGGKLGITGDASGAGIVLTDGAGTKIALDKATAPQTLGNGDNTLSFSAYVQGDGASVVPGEFNGVADFTLAYQ